MKLIQPLGSLDTLYSLHTSSLSFDIPFFTWVELFPFCSYCKLDVSLKWTSVPVDQGTYNLPPFIL